MDRFCRGNGLIIDISGDKDTVRLFFPDDGKDLPKDVFLIFQQGILV